MKELVSNKSKLWAKHSVINIKPLNDYLEIAARWRGTEKPVANTQFIFILIQIHMLPSKFCVFSEQKTQTPI